eukprot:m.73185 g.73185  ORF g.73185 m.73185 type:complete len:128 (-) comp18783_c1_seq1:122-505(-)
MAALSLMGRLPTLVPGNTDLMWQGQDAAMDPVAALRQQELDFQKLLQAVKVSASTNHVIGRDPSDLDDSESEGSLLSGDDESQQSLEYPSDEGDSPLDQSLNLMIPEDASAELDEDEVEEVDNWTFF